MTLAAGTRLAGYEILDRIGAGGMGEVYLARDMGLRRQVALKVLPSDLATDSDRRARFEREARAASGLNHPNIVTIHGLHAEGDVAFIVMEYVEGQTLRAMLASGPLPAEALLPIAVQMADGLARAHAAGIVHRDLKPENVIVTPEGRAKILDFGLAKLAPTPVGSDVETATHSSWATQAGVLMGTLGYMSPEQATGRPVDHRTDQFALGAMLYEMATGRRAFARATTAESLTAILRDQPEPITKLNPAAPRPLVSIVERCLAKDPSGRYPSTRDLADDVQRLAAAPSPPSRRLRAAGLLLAAAGLAAIVVLGLRPQRNPSASPPTVETPALAVLPLQLLGGTVDDGYFADGMTESITTDVAKIPGLLVIARDTALRYKGQAIDPGRVGAELGVRYVLQGSVQRAAGRLRLNAQLVDVKTGFNVWADRFDRETKDVFAVQDEICDHIAAALRLTIGAPARVPTSNLEAHDAYLRGLSFADRLAWPEKDKAIPHFERAVALDPQFAMAHAALAVQYARKSFERDPEREWESKAFVETQKALTLDPRLPDPYATRGNLVWTLANGFQHERAAADLRRALQLDPNFSGAHLSLGSVYVHVGLLDRALAELREGLRHAPGDAAIQARIARVHLYRGEYAQALAELQRNGELARSWQAVLALQGLHRHDEAVRLVQELLAGKPERFDEDLSSAYAILLAESDQTAAAEEQIARAVQDGEGSSHFHHAMHAIGSAYALMDRKVEAMRWLKRAAAEGLPCYPLYARDTNLRALHGDPAFEAFLSELKGQWERFSAELP